MKIGPHVFPKSGTHTQTDRRGNFIYIEDGITRVAYGHYKPR